MCRGVAGQGLGSSSYPSSYQQHGPCICWGFHLISIAIDILGKPNPNKVGNDKTTIMDEEKNEENEEMNDGGADAGFDGGSDNGAGADAGAPEAAAPPPPPPPPAPDPAPEPAPEAEGAAERTGFGRRLGAYILDIIIAYAVGAGIGMVAGATLLGLFGMGMAEGGGSEAEAMMGGLGAMIGGALGAMAGMYLMYIIFLLLEAFMGQTPGKMILGIKIANADGTQAGVGKLLLRAVLKNIYYAMALLAGITGIGALMMVGTVGSVIIFIGCFVVLGAARQAFHDMIAKTAVYKKSDIK